MTDNEIIKVLEFCPEHNCDVECPLFNTPYCVNVLMQNALDLIQRQQKKIESKINGNFSLSVIKSAKDEAVKEFAYKVVERLERLPNVNSDYWNFSDLIDRDDALEIVKGGAEDGNV